MQTIVTRFHALGLPQSRGTGEKAMNQKFEFVEGDSTEWYGRTLKRIRAVASFGIVVKGELGGYIETEKNVAETGAAWVSGAAQVSGDARVSGDAQVSGNASFLFAGPIGSRAAQVTFCVDAKLKISVSTGCFFGSLTEFAEAVEKTHGDNEHGRIYRALIEWVRLVFTERGKELP